MRKLSFILFFFPCLLFGQSKTIDSLKLALKNAKHDTARCNILSALVDAESDNKLWPKYNEQIKVIAERNIANNASFKNTYIKHLLVALQNFGFLAEEQNDLSKALEYYQRSLKVSEEIGDEKGVAGSFYGIGTVYSSQGDVPKAIEYFLKSLKIREEILDKQGMALCLNDLGNAYQKQGDVFMGQQYFFKSLKISEEIHDKPAIALSLNNLGYISNNLGDISKALEYHHKSLKIAEEIGDKGTIALSLNNIGAIYQRQGDLPKAIEYFLKSLKIREEIGEKKGAATSLNNLGHIYSDQGVRDKALVFFHKSLKIMQEIGNKWGIATALSNIGFNYGKQGQFQKALEFYTKSLKIREEIKDKQGLSNILNNIAQLMLKEGRIKEALSFADKGMKTSRELGYPVNIKYSAQSLKQIFQKKNKYKEAFEMYELEIKMTDSINNQETQKAAVKKQIQYTYEKKAALDSTEHAKENDIKNAEILARKAELKVKQNTQYALYGGLALVLVFAGFMFNRYKVTQKQKQIIEVKEKETQQQKHVIEEKHKEITDSINYAERIQRSFIATKEILDENLSSLRGAQQAHATDEIAALPLVARNDSPDYFVLFKPKDVVSGDFYWAHKLNNGNFALATADSTGHGVPGAIMSLLNITSLEKAIETLTEPAEILNSTRKTIIERLKKDGSEHGGKDGMDASLCVFDFKNKKLIVAAANNPVWIVRKASLSFGEGREGEAEVIEIKPDKMPIGKHDRDTVSFTQQEIDLQSGDVVYTLTDGFPDQFGGEKGKKFMNKNLRELLAANSHLPMHEQKLLLEKTFADWVGDLEQVDDVTLIGVRI